MAIEDYIPNIFGGAPTMYQGLLNPKDQAALERRANLGGLLGAVGALAQGMSPQGYRRSPIQNVLSALGAGFQGAGQTYESGINQMANVQKLQQSQAQMQAINQLLQDPRVASDPMMVAYIRANPAEAIKYFAEMAPLQQAVAGTTPAPAARPVTTTNAATITPPPAVTTTVSEPSSLVSGAAPTTPEAAVPAKAELPPVTVQESPAFDLQNQKQSLMDDINTLSATNQRIAKDPRLVGQTAIAFRKANNEQITNLQNQVKEIDNQINRVSVANFDFDSVINSVPDQFKGRIKAIQKTAKGGTLSMEKLSDRIDGVLNDANQFASKQVDFTNENRALFGSMFKNSDGTPKPMELANDAELSRFLAEKQKREKELRIAGRTQQIVNVGDKVLAGERAKAQSRAEESAINAQSAASDVKAIVDILQPYRGGAWQDFAGQIGAYLPDTKAEQLATARQTAEAIRAKLAPTLRVEGSGATSDFEIKSFLSAIPSLFNTREGRQTLSTYAQRLADRSAAAADVRAELVEAGTFSIANFQKAMRERGLDRVFTPEDIKVLRGGVATESGTNMSPEGQKAFEKYRPR
jgi:hypothetical protein